MAHTQLTKQEQSEPYNKTLGRLKTAISLGKQDRAIALLEKIIKESADIMFLFEAQNKAKDTSLDIFDLMKPYQNV